RDSHAGAMTTDICGMSTLSYTEGTWMSTGCTDEMTITVTATDECGLTTSLDFTYTITDTTPPTLTGGMNGSGECTGVDPSMNAGYIAWRDNHAGAMTTDICGMSTLSYTEGTWMSTGCTDEMTITVTATDECGLTTSLDFTYTITDTTPPTLTGGMNGSGECTGSDPSMNAGYIAWRDSHAGAMTTDICGMSTLSYTEGTWMSTGCTDEMTITVTATDECGLTTSLDFTYTITDTTPPTLTGGMNGSGECTGSDPSMNAGYIVWRDNHAGAMTTDICGMSTLSYTEGTWMSTGCTDEMTITVTATDECGLMTSLDFTYTITDTTPPTLTGGMNGSGECTGADPSMNAGYIAWRDNHAGAMTTDICGVSTLSYTEGTWMSTGCTDEMTITVTATDECGLATSSDFIYTITDTTPPIVTAPGNMMIDGCGPADITLVSSLAYSDVTVTITEMQFSNEGGSFTEVCGIQSINYFDGMVMNGCVITVTRTFTVIDMCGNMGMGTQVFTIEDLSPPMITAPMDLGITGCDVDTIETMGILPYSEIEMSISETQLMMAGGMVIENCNIASITYQDVMSTGCPIEVTRTFRVENECGLTSSDVQIITISDNLAPVVMNPPMDVMVLCEDDIPAVPDVIAEDNCLGTITGIFTETDNGGDGTSGNPLIITRTWTFEDNCMNPLVVTQTITVQNNMPPMQPIPPADVTVSCADDIPPNVELTAVEECGLVITVFGVDSDNGGDGCPNSPLVITRTWTFMDSNGDEYSVSQTITVVDDEAPQLPNAPPPANYTCETEIPPPMPLNAVDNCDGNIMVSPVDTRNSGTGCLGSPIIINRKWIFEDMCGNKDSIEQIISVEDNVPPTAVLPPDISIDCSEDPYNLGITGEPIMVMDNCPANGMVTVDSASVEIYDMNGLLSGISRTWTLTDPCGNQLVHVQEITIEDNEPPVLQFCDEDQFIQLDPGECEALAFFLEPQFTDNCGIVIERTDTTGLMSGDPFFVGSNIIEWTATDVGGNTAVCQIEIFVQDFTPNAFACKGMVNVSLGEDCKYTLRPEDVLEGGPYGCLENYEVTVGTGTHDNIIPIPTSPMITGDYIGIPLIYVIEDPLSGLKCWGYILIEDKLSPRFDNLNEEINCGDDTSPDGVGFPFDESGIMEIIGDSGYIVDGVDNCLLADVTYSDSLVIMDCNSDYTEVIYRRWTGIDELGNIGMGVDTIKVLRLNLDDVIMPPNYNDVDESSLACEDLGSVWNLLSNGNPSPDGSGGLSGTGRPEGVDCENVLIQFDDLRIEQCEEVGNCFKILRTWTVLDWCTNEDSTHTQIIKVIDDKAPEFVDLPDTIYVDAAHHVCEGNVVLDIPEAVDNCAQNVSVDAFGNAPVTVTITDVITVEGMPLGPNTIYLSAEDCCGNIGLDSIIILVEDNTAPVAICKEYINVSLTYDEELAEEDTFYGIAKVFADNLNNGSHDNCNPVWMKVRRKEYNDQCEGEDYDHLFNDYVKLCCEDADVEYVEVMLRVYDVDPGPGPIADSLHLPGQPLFGRYNDCWSRVYVEDKLPPELIAPSDVTVSCEYYFSFDDLGASFGIVNENSRLRDEFSGEDFYCEGDPEYDASDPWVIERQVLGLNGYAIDACGVVVEEEAILEEDCDKSLITRYFTATDEAGNSSTAVQYIYIQNCTPYYINDVTCEDEDPADGVIWPCDYETTGCTADTDPSITGEPIITAHYCEAIGVSYEDYIFENNGEGCTKIIRVWEVTNLCSHDVEDVWHYSQTIKIIDDIAPFIIRCNNVTSCAYEGCESEVELKITAVDNCKSTEQLDYYVEVDVDSDGIIDHESDSLSYSLTLPIGEHKAYWTVSDGCGNVSTCEQTITIFDCKPPTPYCYEGLSTSISGIEGTVTIWASDFDRGSFDECSGPVDFSIGPDRDSIGITISCEDLNGLDRMVIDIPLYVWDTIGNYDLCETHLVVTVGNLGCDEEASMTFITGRVDTESGEGIEAVEIDLMDDGHVMSMDLTSDDGSFMIEDVLMNAEYKLELNKEDDPLNGVSTLDIVILQQHILGIKKLPSAYQLIAGDVNENDKLSATDIIEMRRLILGIDKDWRFNKPWRFIPAGNYSDEDVYHVEMDGEEIESGEAEMIKNYVGVKIGDLSGDVDAHYARNAGSRSSNLAFVEYGLISNETEGEITIPIFVSTDEEMTGLQLELGSSNDNLEILDVHLDEGIIESDEVYVMDGSVRISKANRIEVGTRIKLLDLKVRIWNNASNGQLGLELKNEVLNSEWYNNELTANPFMVRNIVTGGPEVSLKSVNPNPFADYTQLSIYSDKDRSIRLLLTDLSGKTLRMMTYNLNSGLNQLRLEREQLDGGIYIIRSIEWPQLNHKVMVVD
ncbi:MAG: HYR domain-containing protein, partial [Saprospiraceae bacterium]|nr:HYR domain-containing protein [Saprospiraceae bacterium]